MPSITTTFARFIKPYQKYILVTLIIILFIFVALFAFFKYAQPLFARENLTTQSDIANAQQREQTVEVIFFHVDWCPHCKRAQPHWDEFVTEYDKTTINGYVVNCIDIDCTDDANTDIQNKITKYDIQSYPTLKMQKDTDVIDFDAKITKETLEQFIQNTLQK